MYQWTLRDLEKRRTLVPRELHPELWPRVKRLIEALDHHVTPYEGFRGREAQEAALRRGSSKARFGQSPHNYRPALACDLVLNPEYVEVRPHPLDERFPDLWDYETPAARAIWDELHLAAQSEGLERVLVDGKLDRPHVQLARWRTFIPN